MSEIQADSSKLAEDARHSAKLSLEKAVEAIDKQFRKGYAEATPALTAGFIIAASKEIAGTTIAKTLLEIRDELKEMRKNIDGVAGQIENLKEVL